MLSSIVNLLPRTMQMILSQLPSQVRESIEEIRVRESRPLEIGFHDSYAFLDGNGNVTLEELSAYKPTTADCMSLLEMLTNHSLYTYEEELRRGYITIAGGHRVGLAGRTVLEQGNVKQIRDVSSFNIRIAKDIVGVSNELMPYLLDPARSTIHHTLIISPPQQGKTTLLRDIVRNVSKGNWGTDPNGISPILSATRQCAGKKVGIVDERSELAASSRGVPKFDVGPRTDVLDGCPKAEGMMMMIRSMSPEVLAVDEIGRPEDAAAIHEAIHAGVRIVATAHGADFEDVRMRPVLKQLLEEGVFSRYIVLDRRKQGFAPYRILDGTGRQIQVHRIGRG
ncbi:stage III sporulation protein AA [Paenibacillus hexagrammi]|uniref:Stage III sporulation protein AA n=1 Tax=Paenibacillus hexagrammi TaxID=2908839 RepID=A0ABY3SBW4_9BACL|nr:stage III sporulation protein AA [Paenibacillus sp. YPD9-1]UJF31262.1 stage III sporulation protein AA [Paenibacillus sp. YPD9-1]